MIIYCKIESFDKKPGCMKHKCLNGVLNFEEFGEILGTEVVYGV